MRKYEALVIADSRLEEADLDKAVNRFVEAVRGEKGEVDKLDRWGVRRLAYEIDHHKEGYYFVCEFRAPEGAIEPLERMIRISDEYLRAKIIRPE